MSLSNRNIRRFLMTSAVALCLPLTSFAQEASAPAESTRPTMGHRDGKAGREGFHREGAPGGLLNPRLMKALDLSQAQRDELKKLAETDRDARRSQHEELMASRKALRDLVAGNAYTDAKAKDLASRIASQESARILARAEQAHRMMQVLTPEQRGKLAELAQKHRSPRGERRPPVDKG